MRAVYAPVLERLRGEVTVAGVCDLDEALARRMGERFPEAAAFTSLAALLEGGGLDAVLVLTSEAANVRVTQQVLAAGAPVFLEKPPAVSARELDELCAVEGGRVYAAFNRRHTPLFQGFQAPAGLRRVSGKLARRGREVRTFPYTAIHLLDAAQFFSGRGFAEVGVELLDGCRWRVSGTLEGGVELALEVAPDGGEVAEYLLLEGAEEAWELQFPNAGGDLPLGWLGRRGEVGVSAAEPLDMVEEMGYAPCLRDFLARLRAGAEFSPHRPAGTRATLEVMEAMRMTVE